MSLNTRLELAAQDASIVVDTPDRLAEFNDAGVLAPLDVHATLSIARVLGEQNPDVLLACALAVRGSRLGHVCIRLDEQKESIVVEGADQDVIDGLPWPDAGPWRMDLSNTPLVGAPGSDAPLVLIDDRLYLHRYENYEAGFAALVKARIDTPLKPVDPALADELDSLLGPDEDGKATKQNRAARIALGGRLAVIAGGPGTGKTYVIAKMLQALARLDGREFPRVALCAPTGKAAARLGEELAVAAAAEDDPVAARLLLDVEASTIHRLLGWHRERGRFAHDARSPLPHELVIVDETSMVSLPLAAKLADSLRPEATLVLVGDPFQLESIEAGTVLADLVGPLVSGEPATGPMSDRVVVLDRVHRFREGGVIADFAGAVRRGDADAAIELLEAGRQGLRWIPDRDTPQFEELTRRVLDQRGRVVELARQEGNEAAALEALTELAVLSAHRRGPNSVAAWRREIESSLDDRFPGLRQKGDWYPGRPIMITRNDPTLQLYNGDIGVAAETSEGLRAVFKRDALVTYPRTHLGEHEAVHALTIHKSQGSQFKEVVVSLPAESSRLLTRELLYTAVTRASDAVTIIGESDVVRRAIERKVQRASGLGDRLWGPH